MGHPSTPKPRFQLADTDIYRKSTILLLSQYSALSSLTYYNSLENGLAIALHRAPQDLDWRALRRGQRLASDPTDSELEHDPHVDPREGSDIDDVETVGVCRPLTRLRRSFRHADDAIRDGMFIPGFWSRSGAKQDLAQGLRAARIEVKMMLEKVRGWWNGESLRFLCLW
jgi:hypothetical protein